MAGCSLYFFFHALGFSKASYPNLARVLHQHLSRYRRQAVKVKESFLPYPLTFHISYLHLSFPKHLVLWDCLFCRALLPHSSLPDKAQGSDAQLCFLLIFSLIITYILHLAFNFLEIEFLSWFSLILFAYSLHLFLDKI